MGEKVVAFPGVTKLDTNPDLILNAAIGQCEGAVVIGLGRNGNLYFASSFADGSDVLWWMRRAEHELMRITDELEGSA